MAESWKSKANRYARGEFTNNELKVIAGSLLADQLIDVATFGRLSKLKGKAVSKIIWPLIKKAGPPAGRAVGATAGMVGRAAFRGIPAVGVAMTGYDAYHRGREDAEQGLPYMMQNIPAYPLMNPLVSDMIEHDTGRKVGTIDILTPALKVRKKVSKYARNVGKAMKAIKASTKGGPKGKLSSPKKTFRTVSKTVSKIMKGGARPRGGITGIISKAVTGVFKKKPKRKKQRRKYTVRRLG